MELFIKCKAQHLFISYPRILVREFPWITPSEFAIGIMCQLYWLKVLRKQLKIMSLLIINSQIKDEEVSEACCLEIMKTFFFTFMLSLYTLYNNIGFPSVVLPISMIFSSDYKLFIC